MAEIHLEDVSRVFPNGVSAVERLNLTVQDGEMLALVGPSGSGKSTMLRLIAGLDSPTSGVIRFDGRCVGAIPARDRNVALAFQRAVLFPQKTVFENLAFGSRLRFRPSGGSGGPDSVENRVREAAEAVGIGQLLERFPSELSGGEQQRVSLARGLVSSAQVLLLDEPLSHLDSTLRSELRDVLKKFHRRRPVTTVVVTHDPAEAMSLGDRVAVMRRGAIEQIGSPRELYERPKTAFVADFVGESPLNRIELVPVAAGESWRVSIGGRDVLLPLKAGEQTIGGSRRRVTLAIRPHEIIVERATDRKDAAGENYVEIDGKIEELSFQGRESVLLVRLLPGVCQDENSSAAHGVLWRALAGVERDFKANELVRLKFLAQRVHWFEGEF